MKFNTIVKKSALAVAISAASVSAFAGVHTVTPASGIVLANEIFGAGSEDTLVAIPVTNYVVANNAILTGEVATVKYTLDKGAVFGEDLSDIDKWAASNATLEFTFDSAATATVVTVGGAGAPYTQNADYTIEVDQGGAIGDNTVTFKITAVKAAAATLDDVELGQVRVKNLTSALERGVTNPNVRLGAEFRNVNQATTDTQQAVVVLRSQDGVELTGNVTDYTVGGGRARIDVADTELTFTGSTAGETGLNASQDFDETNNVTFVTLGGLQVARTTYAAGAEVVKKENGDDFDFQGSDEPVITLSSTAPLAAYSAVYLRNTGACSGTTAGTDFVGQVNAAGDAVSINLQGETTVELEAGYNVCAIAAGNVAIPESTFTAELNVDYFNPRYTDSQDVLGYGPVLRNGCQVTLFNLPNVNAQDNAFIRLTNVSELPGAVRAFVWTQDGQQIDLNSEVSATLAAHATEVFHTNANLASGVYLGDVLPTYGATNEGRHRLVLQGAFPACEALGLVRSPNGTLTNMTSTTYSGDDSRLGTEQSNTSNTSN
jgi:hypothetical protein